MRRAGGQSEIERTGLERGVKKKEREGGERERHRQRQRARDRVREQRGDR